MSYPTKVHIRYSTVMVIVVVLMGSVLYEVTRTESQSSAAARTQDISLPAPEPARLARLAARTHDYIGSPAVSMVPVKATLDDTDLIVGAGYTARGVGSMRSEAARGDMPAAAFGSNGLTARSHSAGGGGFAPGGFGMSGVGAWGGVSGVVRPERASVAPGLAKAAKAKAEKAPSKTSPKRPHERNGSGGAASGAGGATAAAAGGLAAGFTTGAAAVEPGAVASLQPAAGGAPAGPAPAPTPEPMSFLLVGTGLAAIYNVRRHFQ